MAKVFGPLHSDGASGKLANSIVFFPWKGLNVVRKYLIPANPQTGTQGDARMILGGLGRAGHAPQFGSDFLTDAKLVAGPGETYVSAICKAIIDAYMPDGAGFETIYSAYNGHAQKSVFDSDAATLGLTTLDIPYKATTHSFAAGMQLYCLALYAILKKNPINGAFNRAPYTTALASWSSGDVGSLLSDLQP